MIFNKKRSVLLSSLLILFFIQSTQIFSMAQVLTQTWVTYLAPALGHLAMALGVAFSKNRTDSAALDSLNQYVHQIAQQQQATQQPEQITNPASISQGAARSIEVVQAVSQPIATNLPAVEGIESGGMPGIAPGAISCPGEKIKIITPDQMMTLTKILTDAVKPRIKVVPQEQGFLAILGQQAHFANKYKPQSLWTTNNSIPGVTRYQHESGLFAQVEAKIPQYNLGHALYCQQAQSAYRHFALVRTSPEYVHYIRQRLDQVLQTTIKFSSASITDRVRAFFELNASHDSWWVQGKIDPLVRDINNFATLGDYELTSVNFQHNLHGIVTNYLKDIGNKSDVSGLVKTLGLSDQGSESWTSSIYRFARNATHWYPNQEKVFAHPTNQKLLRLIDACDRYDMTQVQNIMTELADNHLGQQIYKEFCDQYHNMLYTKEGIYRLYENDPVWQKLSLDQKNEIALDAIKRQELNHELALRHIVKENICKAWSIPQSALPSVHQTVYKIVDQPELLTSPAKLSEFLAKEATTIPAHEYETWMKSFFCKNGLIADFVNWPEATQYGMPLTIHKQENVLLRHSFNNALSLIHANHAQAPVAKQIICYIERALTTQDVQLAQSYKTIVNSLEHSIANRYPLAKIIPDFSTQYSRPIAIRLQNLLVKMTSKLLESHKAAVVARAAYSTIHQFSDALRALKDLVHGQQEVTGDKIEELIKSGPYQDQVKAELLDELNQALHAQAIAQECGAHLPALEDLPKPITLPWDDPDRKPLKGGQIIAPRPPEMGGKVIGGLPEEKFLKGDDCSPIKLPDPEPCNWSKGYGRLPSFKDPKHVDTNNPQMPPPNEEIGKGAEIGIDSILGGGIGELDGQAQSEDGTKAKDDAVTLPQTEIETKPVAKPVSETQAPAKAETQSPADAKSKVIDPATEQEKAEWKARKELTVKLLKKALDVLRNKYGKDSEAFLKMQEGVRKVIQELNKPECKYHIDTTTKGVHNIVPKELERFIPSAKELAELERLLDILDEIKKVSGKEVDKLIENLIHVFAPEVKVNCEEGKVGTQGAHYYPILELLEKEGLIKIDTKVLNPDGTYIIEWSYHGSKSKESTCFPLEWTEEKIIQKINEAAKNITKEEWQKDGRLEIIGQTTEGIKIKMVFEFQKVEEKTICKMISCYPYKEKKGI
ncbi:MAG: EndoU domain-containing protein [Candidatus Dependentiae bacterium]